MKKIILFSTLLTLAACDTRTPKEVAEDSLKETLQQLDARTQKLSNLYETAIHADNTQLKRMMAINELENELKKYNNNPNIDFEAIKNAIRQNIDYEK